MNCNDKVIELRNKIEETLIPLIDNDYLYLDLPYHTNLGDTLIWQGTLDFLKKIPHKCLMSTCANGNDFMKVARHHREAIILLHGGGNFGDVWVGSNEYRKEVIKKLPGHKIIILPQTIHYNNIDNLKKDACFYAEFPNVTICARDMISLNILKEYFPNNIRYLLPDMAFCMDINLYNLDKSFQISRSLFIRRIDKEFQSSEKYDIVPSDAYISDWPTITIESNMVEYKILRVLSRYGLAIRRRLNFDFYSSIVDFYWQHMLRKRQVIKAIKFINSYRIIYATRMHAIILSILLNKLEIVAFDNSYGKTSSFINTWLRDVECLKLIK